MMPLVKPTSIQKHPLLWGLVWAAGTVALLALIQHFRGESLANLWIAIPIFAAAGTLWGYWMKRHFDRRAGKGAQ